MVSFSYVRYFPSIVDFSFQQLLSFKGNLKNRYPTSLCSLFCDEINKNLNGLPNAKDAQFIHDAMHVAINYVGSLNPLKP